MCGRMTEVYDPERDEWVEVWVPFTPPNWKKSTPRYNVAPTQPVPLIRQGPTMEMARWGLIPREGKKDNYPRINARVENISKVYPRQFAQQRGVVVATSFYEWQAISPKVKIPHAIFRRDGKSMAMAAVWDLFESPDAEPVLSCSIITGPAMGPMVPFHDRQPIILETSQLEAWLSASPKDAKAMIEPKAYDLHIYPVGPRVGNVKNDDPSLIEPVGQSSLFD